MKEYEELSIFEHTVYNKLQKHKTLVWKELFPEERRALDFLADKGLAIKESTFWRIKK